MPLMKGHSPDVVRSNIKELIGTGRKPKQAIAISLANARKFKKMSDGGSVQNGQTQGSQTSPSKGPWIDPQAAKDVQAGATKSGWDPAGWKKNLQAGLGYSDGGQVVDDGGMENIPAWMKPKGGENASMEKMDEKGPEDNQRDIIMEDAEANYYPSEVANPNEMNEAQLFASALRKKAMMKASPENPEGEMDEDDGYAMGGLVEDEDNMAVSNKPSEDMEDSVEDREVNSSVGKPFMKEPSTLGLSEEAKKALMMKKKMRRYA